MRVSDGNLFVARVGTGTPIVFMPAKAGIQHELWIPACAAMTQQRAAPSSSLVVTVAREFCSVDSSRAV
jgi:hypothetical protein